MTDAATKTVKTVTTTTVRYWAKPYGRAQENGPHLADLRAFVAACDGLDDGLLVRISNGHMSEGGRYNVEIEVVDRQPVEQVDS